MSQIRPADPDLRFQVAVDTLLEAIGVQLLDTYREQLTVFCKALQKNQEREGQYVGLWREDTIAQMAEHARHKAARMARHEHNMAGPFVDDAQEEHEQQIYDAAMDDAVDLVNYGAFTVRLVEAASRAQRGRPAT
jgi:hypothetical protein